MEMRELCKDWNKWAEDIYWSHFQTIHFTQFLISGYDRQLVSLMPFPFRIYEILCLKTKSG